jgi:catechol 2,3-dioxygenase-like lactoylglutathione lyase family enzyme
VIWDIETRKENHLNVPHASARKYGKIVVVNYQIQRKNMKIKFESSVLFVADIHASRAFYENILMQKVIADFGENVGFEGGFSIFHRPYAHQVIFGKEKEFGWNNLELYFESDEIEEAVQRLEENGINFVHSIMEQPWGQKVVRFYDPDGHIVEIGEPLSALVKRLKKSGLAEDQIVEKTGLSAAEVKHFLNEE